MKLHSPFVGIVCALCIFLLFPSRSLGQFCSADPSTVIVDMQMIIGGITQVTSLQFAQLPGADHEVLFVVEQNGLITTWDPQNNFTNSSVFLNITDLVIPLNQVYDERGLLGLAFAGDFNTSGKFFIYYASECLAIGGNSTNCPISSVNACNQSEFNHVENLEEWNWNSSNSNATHVRTLLRTKKPFMNHNGVNSLKVHPFEPELLFLGLGDGGLAYDPFENAQNPQKILGKLLAMNMSLWNSTTNCNTPTNNFTEWEQECPDVAFSAQIFALGIRNPSGIAFEQLENSTQVRVIITDVGQDRFEEVDFIYTARSNLGWDIREGFQCVELDTCANETTLTPGEFEAYRNVETIAPVTVLPHNNERLGFQTAILGGFIFKGADFPCQLNGSYVFGGLTSDNVMRTGGIGSLYFIQPNATADPTFLKGCNNTVEQQTNQSQNFLVDLPSLPPFYIPYPIFFKNLNLPDSYFFTSIGTNQNNSAIYVGVSTTSGPVPGAAFVYKVVPIVTNTTEIQNGIVQLNKTSTSSS